MRQHTQTNKMHRINIYTYKSVSKKAKMQQHKNKQYIKHKHTTDTKKTNEKKSKHNQTHKQKCNNKA